MAYDLVIKGAKVVDGSGLPAYMADVAVQDGRIAEIGRVNDSARRTIDADGLVLAPGFIDHHTHLDAHLLWDPVALSSPEHGVTSVVTGNCGLSLMPARPGDESALIGTFVRVEAIPREILESVEWRWKSTADYLAAVGQRLGVNAACMVGHNAVRQFVMGDDAAEREATADEIAAMQDVLRQSMREGAAGLTFNRNRSHFRDDGKPLPSRLAAEDEMIGLASVLSEFNAGVIQHSNMGAHTVENIDWFARLGRASGRPILWSSVNWRPDAPDLWRDQLAHVEGYFEEGLRLYGNTNIIPTSNRFTMRNAQVFDAYSTWRSIMTRPLPERKAALANPALRPALRDEIVNDSRPVGTPGARVRWDLVKVVKAQLPGNKALEGKTITDVSKSRGVDPLDLFLNLALEEDLETVFVRSEVPDDDVVAGIIRSPYTNIGMSDAGAHVAFTAGYGVTSLVLGYWVRERQLLSLEEAVHRLSFKVASIFGIKDRGLVWPGWCADLVLLDPDEVEALEPEEEADYPGGFPRMVQHARGVHATIVNGEVLVENGAHTGAYPGRVLTSGARAG
jgi:N-acyl-D-aspartate/D-glutamate deacylase